MLRIRSTFDSRPEIRRWAIFVCYTLGMGIAPNAVVILTYAILASLLYFNGISQVAPAVQLYRVSFGFRPVQILVSLHAGNTNYPLAVVQSIWSAVSFGPEIRSAFFWFGMPPLSMTAFTIIRARNENDVVSTVASVRLRFAPILKIVTLSMFLYLIMFTTIAYYAVSFSPMNHANGVTFSEQGFGTESVQVVESVQVIVRHANGTLSQPLTRNGTLTGHDSLTRTWDHENNPRVKGRNWQSGVLAVPLS